MSLLMEALRKAEEQKHKDAPKASQDAGGEISLEPMVPPVAPAMAQPAIAPLNAPVPGPDKLPDLPTRLEELDEQFMAHAAKPAGKPREPVVAPPREAPTPSRADSDVPAREATRNLFESKQSARKSGNHAFAVAAGLLGLIGAVGIGVYFWWQLQPQGGIGVPSPMASLPPPQAVAPKPAPVATPLPIPTVPPGPTFASSAEPDEEVEETLPLLPRPAVEPPARSAPPTPARTESPIRLAATPPKPDLLPEQAWQAFNNGEFNLARVSWKKLLARDPRNPGALHGLAALAQRDGRPGEAAEFYLRALEIDPKDAVALAGLTSLRAPIDALRTESQLKILLAEQPDSPHLNFALGNLYARESRWTEAQQAYFQAHAADAANPDYLFNLAVSLDQLRQRKLAAQHYRQALDAATRRPAGFDTAAATERLESLQAVE